MGRLMKICLGLLSAASLLAAIGFSLRDMGDTIVGAPCTRGTDGSEASHTASTTLSTKLCDVGCYSDTASSPDFRDVAFGRDFLICYEFCSMTENCQCTFKSVAIEEMDSCRLEQGTAATGLDLEERPRSLCIFSRLMNSSFLCRLAYLFSSDPTDWHSFTPRNFSFLSLSIILSLFAYQSFLPLRKASPDPEPSETSLSSAPVGGDTKRIGEEKVESYGELLLDLDAPLSQGTRSKVYRGTHCHKPVAVKVAFKAGSSNEATQEPAEVKYLRILHHPQVVRLIMSGSNAPFRIRSSWKQANKQTEMPYETLIVMEYCDRGTLHQAIKHRALAPSIGCGYVTVCALEVAQAMAHVHSKRVIHGALHSKHIFLQADPTDPRGFTCKVGGFGSCLRLSHGSSSVQCNRIQNVVIAPPEALRSGMMSSASDVYAFGVLLYTMYASQSPFHGLRSNEIKKLVLSGGRPTLPRSISLPMAQLINECWMPYAHERPSFTEIVNRLQACALSQKKRRTRTDVDSQLRSYTSTSTELGETSPEVETLVPGKRYACINFQPSTHSKRESPPVPCRDHTENKDRRRSAPRRTKSCITSFGPRAQTETNHEAFVRQVDELIKRSRKSETKAELKQFLNTLAHRESA